MKRLFLHCCCLLLAVAPQAALAQAAPATLLSQARAKLAGDDTVAADALFQQVIDHTDASLTQVEEALFWQIKLYYGDVFGAALLMGPFSAAQIEGSSLPQDVARQMLLARRAFQMAASRYLNTTAVGSGMTQLKIDLPALTDGDVSQLKATLSDAAAVKTLLSGYSTDPSAGKGLVALSNRFGLYIALGSDLPKRPQGQVGGVRSQLASGVSFDETRMLDWLAEVTLELHGIVNEPNGPDLLSVSKRADERLLKLVPADSNYAKNAARRAKQR